MIRVKIRGKPSMALVDSGACYSVIDYKLLGQFRLVETPLTREPRTLFNANGGAIKMRGMVMLDLDIAGRTFSQKCLVADGFVSSIILGLDFMRDHNVNIDIPMGVVRFRERDSNQATEGFTVPLLRKSDFVATARSTLHIMLKPGFEVVLPVFTEGGGRSPGIN